MRVDVCQYVYLCINVWCPNYASLAEIKTMRECGDED